MVKSKKETLKNQNFILNCIPSIKPEDDWTFQDAVSSGLVDDLPSIPSSKDLREDWWKIRNQGSTGACVGFATADGLLRWHFITNGKLLKNAQPSPRFIWMANKETDEITNYPTTFLETAGTQTKLALKVARNYGCVLEKDLPMDGKLSMLKPAVFFSRAAKLRITSYHNLGRNLTTWKMWLALVGPILTRLGVDATWDNATQTNGQLKIYKPNTVRGGHAVALVGYTSKHIIVRNSWGTNWGNKGFAYASNAYAKKAFTEAYGLIV
ncbi:MAG: C1 family peptidase [candidate division Zixibacteria bacterium]